MQVLISDANVLIDMEAGELLELMFALPFEFKVSDMLFRPSSNRADVGQHDRCHANDASLP